MKLFFSATVLTAALMFMPAFVFAADTPSPEENTIENASLETKSTVQNPAEKLNRGIINIVTAPIEIAKQVDLSWKKSADETKPVSVGIFSGLLKGLVNTVGRAGSGLWDVVTFPFTTSKNHEPLMKPEFVLDSEK